MGIVMFFLRNKRSKILLLIGYIKVIINVIKENVLCINATAGHYGEMLYYGQFIKSCYFLNQQEQKQLNIYNGDHLYNNHESHESHGSHE